MANEKQKRRIKSNIDSTVIHGDLIIPAHGALLVSQKLADELIATGYFVLDELEGE